MSIQTISAGVSSGGFSVTSGNELVVLSGGSVSNITVDSGGVLEVDSGGIDSASILSGGSSTIYGSAIGDLVSSGGAETVFGGGNANGPQIANFGLLKVSSGGSAANTVDLAGYPGGDISVLPGGHIDSTTLFGGQLGVAGVASNTVLSGGLWVFVDGGVVSGLTVASGSLWIASGSVSGAVISAGAAVSSYALSISSGMTVDISPSAITATMMVSGVKVLVDDISMEPGALDELGNLTVLSGAVLSLTAGVTLSNLTVSAGGKVIGPGFLDNVIDYGVVSGAMIGNAVNTPYSGDLQVMGGGLARDVTVEGTILEHRNGTMSNVTLSSLIPGSGAVASVFGNAVNTQVENGVELALGPVGATTGTVVSSGGMEVLSGGVASGLTVLSAGHVVGYAYGSPLEGVTTISSGGGISAPVGSGATLIMEAGATGSPTMSNGSTLEQYGVVVSSGDAYDAGEVPSPTGGNYVSDPIGAVVLSGGTMVLFSDSTLDEVQVKGGGKLMLHGSAVESGVQSGFEGGGNHPIRGAVLSSGAVLGYDDETIFSGAVLRIESNSFSNRAFVQSGGLLQIWSSGATAEDTTAYGGGVSIKSGGVARYSYLELNGFEYARAGGSSISAALSNGGLVYAGSGGFVGAATVLKSGVEIVESSGTDSGALISAGGRLLISSGGVAIGDTVRAGGAEVVKPGGIVSAAVIIGGGELNVSAGGIVAGGLTLSGGKAILTGVMSAGQTVSFVSGGMEDLVLDNLSGFAAKIAGFTQSTQMIDLSGFAYSSTGETVAWSQTGTSGTLTVSDGGKVASLTLIGGYSSVNFTLSDDGNGGTYVVDPPIAGGAAKPAIFAQTMAGFGAGGGLPDGGPAFSGMGLGLLGAPLLAPMTMGSAAR